MCNPKNRSFLLALTCLIALFWSCRSVKYVPDNQFLLTRAIIDVDDRSIDQIEMRSYLKQKPNTRILGVFRFHLGLYNLSSKKKEDGWLKRIGEAPVIYSPYLTDQSKIEFEKFMRNKGYYHALVTDSVQLRKNKKARVYYKIVANAPHRINSYKIDIHDKTISGVNQSDSVIPNLKTNGKFDTDQLAEESNKVMRRFQNEGFYRLNKNEIYFEADTTKATKKVDLKMIITKQNVSEDPSAIVERDHQRYTFRNFYFFTDYDTQKQLFNDGTNQSNTKWDTVRIGNQYFISKGKIHYNPAMLMSMNHINDRGYYSVDLVERTYNDLFSLRLFKLINIRFTETNEKDLNGNPTLDCIIQLSPSVRQSYTISAEGTNSLGNLGVAGNLGYRHKNLFRGGEMLDVTLLGATEKITYGKKDSTTTFHSYEMGVDTKITLPKFLAPIRTQKLFRYSTPQTLLNLSYNYQQRPDYTRRLIRASIGYQWKSSDYTTHRLNLMDLNLVKMFAYDSAFVQRIENLYIRSSYTDHSITALNYSYTWNNQNLQKRSNYHFLRLNLETAGNVLYGLSRLTDRPLHQTDSIGGRKYFFLGTPFAQYVKSDFEYRKGFMIDKYNSFVIRAFAGIAVPFGNSDQVPFERKYFTGGANGIRAWAIRTLGPGSYQASPNEFPNQSGDIKLEANAEYRFGMIGPLEGALFLDTGNIWSLRDNRPGAEFRFDQFYNQIAIGTGFGLRYDFSFVILRVDVGLKVHDPSLDPGSRWDPAKRLLRGNNTNFTFAIGYPF